jgi:D-3-phosphoglycerate dehydrogenase
MRTSFPKNRIKAVLLENIHPAGVELFKSEGFQVESHNGAFDEAKLIKSLADAHVLGIRSKTEVTPRVLAHAPKLLSVGCFCIGTNQVALKDAKRVGLPVFNSPFSNTRSVAELTIAETIALSRRLTEKSQLVHKGVWDKSAAGAHEVRGRTLGIVGYGHIGSSSERPGRSDGHARDLPRHRLETADGQRPAGAHPGGRAQGRRRRHAARARDRATANMIGGATQEDETGRDAHQQRTRQRRRCRCTGRGPQERAPRRRRARRLSRTSPRARVRGSRARCEVCPNVILTPHVGGSTEEAQETIAEDVAEKLIKFINIGSTTGAVNVPEVELPEQTATDPENEDRVRGGGKAKRPHRILHFHRNVPGVLSNLHSAIAKLGANISAEHLRTDDEIGFVVLDVDPTDGEKVLAAVRGIPETVRVRMLW